MTATMEEEVEIQVGNCPKTPIIVTGNEVAPETTPETTPEPLKIEDSFNGLPECASPTVETIRSADNKNEDGKVNTEDPEQNSFNEKASRSPDVVVKSLYGKFNKLNRKHRNLQRSWRKIQRALRILRRNSQGVLSMLGVE